MDTSHGIIPQQPGLRSFIVYNGIRADDLVFEVTGHEAEPHLKAGDFAVIDTDDREPIHGEMYLIEFAGGQRTICEVVQRHGHYGKGGVYEAGYRWWLQWRVNVWKLSGEVDYRPTFADGPYATEHVMEKIVGKVVGIYEPDFRKALAA